MNPAAPILLFDSGVGGLTVLAELRKLLPEAPVIYAADTAGLPYGEKTEAEIAARVAGLLGRLAERYSPRLITIACNTASTIALGMVREVLHVPIVGTVPAIKPAAAMTQTGVDRPARHRGDDPPGLCRPARGRVRRRQAPDPPRRARARRGRRGRCCAASGPTRRCSPTRPPGLRAQPGGEDIDTVVLACTHFPLVEAELRAALGTDVRFVHGAEGIARRIAFLTQGQPFAREDRRFRAVHRRSGSIRDAAAGAARHTDSNGAERF